MSFPSFIFRITSFLPGEAKRKTSNTTANGFKIVAIAKDISAP